VNRSVAFALNLRIDHVFMRSFDFIDPIDES